SSCSRLLSIHRSFRISLETILRASAWECTGVHSGWVSAVRARRLSYTSRYLPSVLMQDVATRYARVLMAVFQLLWTPFLRRTAEFSFRSTWRDRKSTRLNSSHVKI